MDARAWDRVAGAYLDHIVSPFAPGVRNPLPGWIDRLRGARRMTVADFGCGVGELLPFLAARFRRVVAVDFSPRMLREARRRCRARNVEFVRADFRRLAGWRGAFDAAVAVNSVLMPEAAGARTALAGIAASLLPGAAFFGCFPSMEAILHHAVLVREREPTLARARRVAETARYDFVAGVYDDGDDRQKLYYELELRGMLRSAGFRRVRLDKALYPWSAAGGDFERFPGEPRMWDWVVRARVPRRRATGHHASGVSRGGSGRSR
ncbi:MAG: class I SAM-dependent methyltransferase [Planctomycetota bacterium]